MDHEIFVRGNVVLCSVNQLPVRTFTFQEPVVLARRCYFTFEEQRRVSDKVNPRQGGQMESFAPTVAVAPSTPAPKMPGPARQEMDLDTPHKNQSSADLLSRRQSSFGGNTGRGVPRPKVGGLCVVLQNAARLYLDTGVDYTVPLPFAIREVWPLGGEGGLLMQRNVDAAELKTSPDEETIPTLYSLHHPLDELKPVAVAPPSSLSTGSIADIEVSLPSPQVFMSPSRKAPSSISEVGQQQQPPPICKNQTPNIWQLVVAVLPEASLLVAYDSRDHRHTVWTWTRRPSPPPVLTSPASPITSASSSSQNLLALPSSTAANASTSASKPSKRNGSPAVFPATPLASNKQASAKTTPSFMSPSSGTNRDAAYHSPPQKDIQKKGLDSEVFLELVWIETLSPEGKQIQPANSVFLSHDLDENVLICIFKKMDQSLLCLSLNRDIDENCKPFCSLSSSVVEPTNTNHPESQLPFHRHFRYHVTRSSLSLRQEPLR